jgi:hypothetical protein
MRGSSAFFRFRGAAGHFCRASADSVGILSRGEWRESAEMPVGKNSIGATFPYDRLGMSDTVAAQTSWPPADEHGKIEPQAGAQGRMAAGKVSRGSDNASVVG